MKYTHTILLLFSFFLSSGQKKANAIVRLTMSKYAGVYSYGKEVEKEPIGTVYIYPETDTTVLFYLDLNRGAPSYDMGALYGHFKIVNNKGIFDKNLGYSQKSCKLTVCFSKNKLSIMTDDRLDDCGFGFAVNASGTYRKTSNKKVSYFVDQEGKKIYFKKTSPESYYKE